MATLIAGLPETVPGQTVNRLCASGLQAIASAAQAIAAGEGSVFIAGGVESMTRSPYIMLKPDKPFARGDQSLVDSCLGWRFVNPKLAARHYPYSMGETAENVAERCQVSREAQDAFAAESQRRAEIAMAEGRFEREIVPVPIQVKGGTEHVATDEHPRPGTSRRRSCPAETGLSRRRQRHRRQFQRDQRRSSGGARRRGNPRGPARTAAESAHPRFGGCWTRSGGHGARPDCRDPKASPAHRTDPLPTWMSSSSTKPSPPRRSPVSNSSASIRPKSIRMAARLLSDIPSAPRGRA